MALDGNNLWRSMPMVVPPLAEWGGNRDCLIFLLASLPKQRQSAPSPFLQRLDIRNSLSFHTLLTSITPISAKPSSKPDPKFYQSSRQQSTPQHRDIRKKPNKYALFHIAELTQESAQALRPLFQASYDVRRTPDRVTHPQLAWQRLSRR